MSRNRHPTIIEETKAMLAKRRAHESRTSIAANSGVNPHWLEKFDQGVLNNPTLENIEKLRRYLINAQVAA